MKRKGMKAEWLQLFLLCCRCRKPACSSGGLEETVDSAPPVQYEHHTSLSAFASKQGGMHECVDNQWLSILFFLADCLNCSGITDLNDRLNSLEAKVQTSLKQPRRLDLTLNSSCFLSLLFCLSVPGPVTHYSGLCITAPPPGKRRNSPGSFVTDGSCACSGLSWWAGSTRYSLHFNKKTAFQ